ncbi:MAG TPA: AraC family transcriptional regulator [Candidatus Acidoferrales bacterium]|nr:AraC family transcriptional regulator [Candidatus Acidoferrales bacterium]
MPISTFRIPDAMPKALKTIGVDPAILLRKSSLPPTLWTSGKGVVTTDQWFALWRALPELVDDPAIGLKLPALVPLEQHHPISIAAQHARTFRDALQRLARYKILCCAEEMLIVEGNEECRVGFNWILSREFAPPLLIDTTFASMVELGRRGTRQPVRALRVELARNDEHRELYEAHFGCPVKFKTQRNAIIFRTSDLNFPFVTYNAELLAMLGPGLDRELARRKADQTLIVKVKWVLGKLLGGNPPDIMTVAKELGISSRTLQRRITEEGTSFRQLLSDARHELARHYLLQPTLELGETAYLLGYEDPNSFFRAFREWEGMTPSEWKMAHRN